VFYGGDPISQEPDLTITPPADSLFAGTVSGGDFDGDGVSDLLIGYGVEGNGFDALRNDIYFGGSSPDATSDHTVLASDVGFPIHAPRVIGDVNGDGATDWMATDRGFNSGFNVSGQNIAIFFGGSSLPTTADQTLQYPGGRYVGEVSAAVGDVNDDGFDDFAFSNSAEGHVDVYFGGSSPSFSAPADLALPITRYPGIAGGDFNGDGTSDIAAMPYFIFEDGELKNTKISIFHGGSDIDSLADQQLPIPASAAGGTGDINGDGFAEYSIGTLESAGDVDGNGAGADELIHGSSFFGFGTNALLYRPSTSSTPLKVFRAPNQDAALGSQQFIYSTAIGDFTGDGTTDFVGTQFNDDNDAAFSSRVYRYEVTASPIEEGTIADARQQGPDSMVTVQGTVTRAYGSYLRFQDQSGPTGASALVVRQTTDDSLAQAFRADIADGTIQPGTQIEVTGTLSAFAGLLQISDGDLDSYQVLGQGDPPAPQAVTLAELSNTGEDYESELVTVDALLFSQADSVFENGTTYGVSGNTGSLAFRVQDTSETAIGGESIPENLFMYTGVVGQFNDFSGQDEGYQLLPVRPSDIEEQMPMASSTVTVETDSIYEFGGTGTRISFANTSGSGAVTVKRFGTAPAAAEDIPERNVSQYRYRIEASDSLGFGTAQVRFDVSMLPGVSTPSDVKIYTRSTPGQGRFTELPVSYADSTNELVATTETFSEFVFASDSSDNPLPVELAGFDATVDGDAVRLTWQTVSETGNARFEVQRRVGEGANGRGGTWTKVGVVEGNGTTAEARSYRFTDGDLPYEADALTYRLKQVDTDGSAHYSRTITVERGVDKVELLGTYPNPASQQATVRYALPGQKEVSIRLYDVLGRQVRTVVRGKQSGRQKRRVDVSDLASGVYFLRLRAGGQVQTQKLTVVR
ncbi:MAG: T9SS type A sorting domain-containing protein, partial [Salinibacter sp.]